ncbi:MAG: hypothetical protein ABIT71_07230 [Vicinamibacteraceae bacterium]
MPTSERPDAAPARGLLAHAAYACRHSGVCCSSDWDIPVDDALHARLTRAIAAGELRPRDGVGLRDRPDLPSGTRTVLGLLRGRCVFHREGPCGCGLHAWGGADAKPAACRQFPWIAVHDPRGTFVSLSHVCPSAADRLTDPSLLVVAPLPRPGASFEGLDIRRALPPAIDARRLLDWDALTAWETQALDACARAETPEGVLADLSALRAHARTWTRRDGALADWIARWTPAPHAADVVTWQPDPALDAIARAAVPPGLAVPPPIAAVAPAWRGSAPLLRRYLAARLLACWPLHYGRGLATALAYVAALLTIVAGELARRGVSAAPTDADVLAAIGETDRLVVHLAAPDALARGLDGWAAGHLEGGL